MEEYKKSFINFMVDSQVLKFGEFTLKSGRKSPFFMNAGAYKTGSQLIKLGEYYARAINVLLWRSVSFTDEISNIAATARRSKTTVTRESFWVPASEMRTGS